MKLRTLLSCFIITAIFLFLRLRQLGKMFRQKVFCRLCPAVKISCGIVYLIRSGAVCQQAPPCLCLLQRLFYAWIFRKNKKNLKNERDTNTATWRTFRRELLRSPSGSQLKSTHSDRHMFRSFLHQYQYLQYLSFQKCFCILETSIVWLFSGYNAQRYLTRISCLLRSCQERSTVQILLN